jgi:hypothetical protein
MRRATRDRNLVVAAAVLAATTSLPAQADTFLPPCQGPTCAAPAVDGAVGDAEYANGVGFPLSNFDAGGPNGALRLHLQGEKLHVGLRVPAPTGTSRGEIAILLDADRPGTTCAPTAELPGIEDRLFRVAYDLAAGTSAVSQLVGNGVGWQAPIGPNWWLKLWSTQLALEKVGGMIEAELAITLRPDGASQSAVLGDGKVGFAMRHAVSGSAEHVPGGASSPPFLDRPCSWETLVFDRPDGVPLDMSVWDLGNPHTNTSDLDRDPEDIADVIWDRDLVCLLDVAESIEDVVAAVNKRRGLNALPVVQPLGDEGQWILTSRGVVASELFRPYSGGVDGAWARVTTDAAIPPGERGPMRAGEFIDVFCLRTRLEEQTAVTWVKARRATDRPALVMMGTTNALPAPPPQFGLDQLTAFDAANGWLSDIYDLNAIAVPQHVGLASTHAFILPATDPWPTFGVVQDPIASTSLHDVTDDGDPLSDEPEVSVAFEMVRTDQPGHWNPKKAHKLTYAITKLDDHASGGCCADWFTTGFGFSNQPHLDFDDDHTPDGDIVNPGWKATTTLSAGQVTAAGPVWEWDSGPNDHYDVIPEAGLFDTDAFFRITHLSGLVERVDPFGVAKDVLGTFEQSPGGFGLATTGTVGETATAFHVITVEEIN